MNLNTYQKIINDIYNYPGHAKELPALLENKYPKISKDALSCIVSNEVQKKTRKTHYKFVKNADDIFNVYLEEREKQGNSDRKVDHKKIVKLAFENEIPATLVVRMILTRFLEKKENGTVIKPSKKAINELIAKPHLIEDSDLSLETYWSVLYDDVYSPIGDMIRHQTGYEYECKLQYHCTLEKFAFKDECVLKREGYDKTPDIKLEIPVMINGSPIMWIESKALFADEQIHKCYIKEQYDCYWNRWGPGLVIYWFGFTEDIVNTPEKRFIIMDQFPRSEDITPFETGMPDQAISTIIEQMKTLTSASYGIEENWDED